MSHVDRVKLQSSDNEIFEVDKSIADEMHTVKNLTEDTGTDIVIPLPDVSSNILARVIEYCTYHLEARESSHQKPAVPENEIKQWDKEFVDVDPTTLYNLFNAAEALNIETLRHLTCRTAVEKADGSWGRGKGD